MNSTTIIGMRRAKAHVDKAVQVLVKHLDDANPYLAQNAARIILERGLTGDAAESGEDTNWVGWATTAELDSLRRIMLRCKRRRDRGDPMPQEALPALQPADAAAVSEPQPADELVIAATEPQPVDALIIEVAGDR